MKYTIWTNVPGDNLHFYIIGTFPGETEAEALDHAARDPGSFATADKEGRRVGYESFEARNKALQFTRDNYKVKKVEE